MRSRTLGSTLLAAVAALTFSGCTAEHRVLDQEPITPLEAAHALPLTAGVMAAETGPGDNVRRIHAGAVVDRFARRLADSGVFERVVYPHQDLEPVTPDVVFAVSVRSRLDLHWWQNVVKQLAVGASFLLLQPVLSTSYDLWLDVEADIVGHGWSGRQSYRGAYRFSYTKLQASESDLQAWKDAATDDAVERLLYQIANDPGLRKLEHVAARGARS